MKNFNLGKAFSNHYKEFINLPAYDLWHVLENAQDLAENNKNENYCFGCVVGEKGNHLILVSDKECGYIDTKLIFKESSYDKACDLVSKLNYDFTGTEQEEANRIISASMQEK